MSTRVLLHALLLATTWIALEGCICGPGEVTCDSACVDTSRDRENCGACGNACRGPQACIEGECVGLVGVACDADPDCDDGLYCNGPERCAAGYCIDAPSIVCNDGIACTDEICLEAQRACVARPAHGRCPSGKLCTAAPSAVDGCQ